MKMNKKLIVPFLATIIGLSVAGGLGGAFAWYQFNSEVRTGFIGSSVADGGFLQISNNGTNWGSEMYLDGTTLNDNPLVPVTFGKLGKHDPLPYDSANKLLVYGYPEAGKQTDTGYTLGWDRMVQNDGTPIGFYQYDIYLRAKEDNKDVAEGYSLSEQAVYISSVVLEDAGGNGKTVSDALRVHIHSDSPVLNGKTDWLISNDEHKSSKGTGLDVYGKLDLDGNNQPDTPDKWNWDTGHNDPLIYGIDGDQQETIAVHDNITDDTDLDLDNDANTYGIVQPRGNAGKMPDPEDAGTEQYIKDRCICKTKTTDNYAKLTITVWLEGWESLNSSATESFKKPIWSPNKNSGFQVHVGLVFDVGRNILG